jgi:hypothetical protein
VRKSRIRNERDPRFGCYMILDDRDRVIHGGHPNAYPLSLDDQETIANQEWRNQRRFFARCPVLGSMLKMAPALKRSSKRSCEMT